MDDVLFLGLNLVGGRVHDPAIWKRKMEYDLDWVTMGFKNRNLSAAVIFAQANPGPDHALFMGGFRPVAREFGRPILFIHGDGHYWLLDQPWLEENITRVQVDKGGIADPLEVRIHLSDSVTFTFERNPFYEEVSN